MMAVQVSRRSPEDLLEARELLAEGLNGASREVILVIDLARQLEVQADCNTRAQEAPGVELVPEHHGAHCVHGPGARRLHDPPVVAGVVAVVVGGDD
jgi:hypothetical protein